MTQLVSNIALRFRNMLWSAFSRTDWPQNKCYKKNVFLIPNPNLTFTWQPFSYSCVDKVLFILLSWNWRIIVLDWTRTSIELLSSVHQLNKWHHPLTVVFPFKLVSNGWLTLNIWRVYSLYVTTNFYTFCLLRKTTSVSVVASGVKVTARRPVRWQSRSGRRCWPCSPKPTGPWPTWDRPNPLSPWRGRWSRRSAGRTTPEWTTEELVSAGWMMWSKINTLTFNAFCQPVWVMESMWILIHANIHRLIILNVVQTVWLCWWLVPFP